MGAEVGKPRARRQGEAAALFEAAFGAELDRLEAGFETWLAALVGG